MRPGARLAAAAGCAAAVALACPPASAQEEQGGAFFTGNDLWARCTTNGYYEAGFCSDIVAGIADAMGFGDAVLGYRACRPLTATRDQARDVVIRYLEQHPEQRHYSAASLVAEALAEAFPCKP